MALLASEGVCGHKAMGLDTSPEFPLQAPHELRRGPWQAPQPRLGHAPSPLWPQTTVTPRPCFLTWGHIPHRTTRGGRGPHSGSTPTDRLFTSVPSSVLTGCTLAMWWVFTPWKGTNATTRCPPPALGPAVKHLLAHHGLGPSHSLGMEMARPFSPCPGRCGGGVRVLVS